MVTLSEASINSITIDFSTVGQTASAGSDYSSVTGRLTFAPGETSKRVLVTAADDGENESSEKFAVNLSNPTGANIGDGQAEITILNSQTKFFVVNDATTSASGQVFRDETYKYDSSGTLIVSNDVYFNATAVRGVASNVAGTMLWTIDANRTVYVSDNRNVYLGSWTAGSLSSTAQVEGIATNGTDVWIVDAKSDKVYRYAAAANRLSGSQNALSSFSLNRGNKNPKDLVTDGTHIWVVEDSTTDKVFKYTLSGSLVGSWTINAGGGRPTGITLDPSGASQSLWIVDNATDRVYEYTNSRARHSGSQSAATSFALAPGNTNPQGIADPPAPVSVPTQSKASGVGSSVQFLSARSFSPTVSSGVPAIEPDRSANELDRSREMVRTLREESPTALLATSRQSNLSELVTQLVRSESSAAAESKKASEDRADLAFTGEAFEWLDDALLGMLAQSR